MKKLSPEFLTQPLAHRGYHAEGRPENSRAAFLAAIKAGYGIELDVQMSSDAKAMVFHDYDLERLTGVKGPIQQRSSTELTDVALLGGSDGIPTLSEVLEIVGGKVPLLIEIKDQDGALGPNVGALEKAVADEIAGYNGPLALMSFNPHSVACFLEYCPDIPRGLTTCHYPQEEWPLVPKTRREELKTIPDYERVGASFISHRASDLASNAVAETRAKGAILCWTIRSAAEEKSARRYADNITFEGYAPDIA